MLLQRPINMRQLGLSNVLSGEETAYMRQMATERFASIMQVLKSMPRPMLLVFRNINTVRSINITLGAPVDRYCVMAKRCVEGEGSVFPPVFVQKYTYFLLLALKKHHIVRLSYFNVYNSRTIKVIWFSETYKRTPMQEDKL